MKRFFKYFLIFTLCLTSFFTLFGFAGCEINENSEKDNYNKTLTDEQIEVIRQAYFDKKYNDKLLDERIDIRKILGTYNGNIVFKGSDEVYYRYPAVMIDIIIDDIFISYDDASIDFFVYNETDKNFLSLQTAYKNGMITKDDLVDIAKQESEKEAYDYNGLSKDEVKRMQLDYLKKVHDVDWDVKDITVLKYLGEYNGNIVVLLEDKVFNYSMTHDVEIDGVFLLRAADLSMVFASYNPEEGNISDLTEAYANGDITKNDLRAIATLANG